MNTAFAHTVLMVRPAAFGFNEQTAADNAFQKRGNLSPAAVQAAAVQEFDTMVETLRKEGIHVLVADDTPHPPKTDAIFPNNWITLMPDGCMDIFPMLAASRRPEKRDAILNLIRHQFAVRDVIDWSEFEADNFFLEGTGSMVMDHANRIIFAGISQRTHLRLLEKFAQLHQYRVLAFDTADGEGMPVYHTNVMLCIGKGFAVVADTLIREEMDWVALSQLLRSTGHQLITISAEQAKAFCANMLQLETEKGKPVLVMSDTAFHAFTEQQLQTIRNHTDIVTVRVPVIETYGGGGARCMMAEIFLDPLH